jgi:hypothetical protein
MGSRNPNITTDATPVSLELEPLLLAVWHTMDPVINLLVSTSLAQPPKILHRRLSGLTRATSPTSLTHVCNLIQRSRRITLLLVPTSRIH